MTFLVWVKSQNDAFWDAFLSKEIIEFQREENKFQFALLNYMPDKGKEMSVLNSIFTWVVHGVAIAY